MWLYEQFHLEIRLPMRFGQWLMRSHNQLPFKAFRFRFIFSQYSCRSAIHYVPWIIYPVIRTAPESILSCESFNLVSYFSPWFKSLHDLCCFTIYETLGAPFPPWLILSISSHGPCQFVIVRDLVAPWLILPRHPCCNLLSNPFIFVVQFGHCSYRPVIHRVP